MLKAAVNCTRPKYVCANERIKCIGTTDGNFPDFGHHLEKEMGGLWLHPIKLLDGFWMKFTDHNTDTVDSYIIADRFENYPHKNEFYYGNGLGHTPVKIKRTQMVPLKANGIIVTYEFENPEMLERKITASLLARTDLRPVWLSEEIGILDGKKDDVEYNEKWNAFFAKDSEHPWFVIAGTDITPEETRIGDFFGPEITNGNGISFEMAFHFTLKKAEKKTIHFYIAGSDISKEECMEQYQILKSGADFEAEKISHFDEIRNNSKLTVEDKNFQTIFDWVKVNTDWLIVDTSKYGRGIAAGLPEYPWWFGCDSFYTLQGVLALGDANLCKDTLELILNYSEQLNGNGRIVHEIITNGASPNLGNTQETAHFISMLWKYYEWTGDKQLLDRAFDYVKKSIHWLLEQDEDEDCFPSGYGIIEIAGLNMEMIDSAVYTYEAYDAYSCICKLMGEEKESEYYEVLAKKVKNAINTQLWEEEEGLYCDAFASYHTVNEKRDIILEQLKFAKDAKAKAYIERILEERKCMGAKECGWLLNRNWVINTPMEIGIAPVSKAERALKEMNTSRFIGPYGMYLDGLKQDATMTISTGVMAVAQSQYGYTDRALELIERIFSSFSMATPGSIAEMSPDYGCFVQAWTTYAVMVPIVRFFFGIKPEAGGNSILFNPCMPKKWKKASLEHVKVLDGEISVYYEMVDNIGIYTVKNTTSANIVIPDKVDYKVILNTTDMKKK